MKIRLVDYNFNYFVINFLLFAMHFSKKPLFS
jgi:hypothetical protein